MQCATVSTILAEANKSFLRNAMIGFNPRVFSEAWRFKSSLFLLLIYDAPLSERRVPAIAAHPISIHDTSLVLRLG